VLEEEWGLMDRHQQETDRRTDSRTTRKTWGPQDWVPRTDSEPGLVLPPRQGQTLDGAPMQDPK
jgi:hypothetical protein